MKIIVDADACPVTHIVERIAMEKEIDTLLICDTSHVMQSTYSQVITVDKGADSADFMVIQKGSKGDVVVTQDYGVAAMALGKGMYAIHQSGKWYTNENIDEMLFERHMAKQARKSSKNHMKGPKKRTREDDQRFEASLRKLIESTLL
ncbi:MAG: YaiI/YqxD family protein [Lachnospiraceae bacterium]|nr:YaiI/YqxD family protein [Lachnospiraceae bacterium]